MPHTISSEARSCRGGSAGRRHKRPGPLSPARGQLKGCRYRLPGRYVAAPGPLTKNHFIFTLHPLLPPLQHKSTNSHSHSQPKQTAGVPSKKGSSAGRDGRRRRRRRRGGADGRHDVVRVLADGADAHDGRRDGRVIVLGHHHRVHGLDGHDGRADGGVCVDGDLLLWRVSV